MSQEPTKTPPKTQSKTKASTTSSTPKAAAKKTAAKKEKPKPTKEELIQQLRDTMAEGNELFGELFEHEDVLPPTVTAGQYDLIMLFDVKVIDKDGELISLKGRTDFPESMHAALLSQTLHKFQRAFVDQVGEPLGARLMRHIGDRTQKLQDDQDGPAPRSTGPAKAIVSKSEQSPDDGFLSDDLP